MGRTFHSLNLVHGVLDTGRGVDVGNLTARYEEAKRKQMLSE